MIEENILECSFGDPMSTLTQVEKRLTIRDLHKKYHTGEKLVALSLYDSSMAGLADQCDVDILLVGDSLGMTMLGYDSTVPVTVEQCLHHTAAVSRGSQHAFILGDMPFLSYHLNAEQALTNAARFLQEAGAQAVKLEGGEEIAPTVKRMVQAGIPVFGHIGILPQAVNAAGGYVVKGRSDECAEQLLIDAKALADAGACGLVLEGIHKDVCAQITDSVNIPTIGIGAGVSCNGQIQVVNDILGLFESFVPKHAKRYANLAETIRGVFQQYSEDVRKASFPCDKNSFS